MPAAPLDRRSFLAAAAATAGSVVSACTGDDDPTGGPRATTTSSVTAAVDPSPPTDLGDWDAVRAHFDLDPDVAHFAAFVLAGHPATVRDAVEHWRAALDTDTEQALIDGARHEGVARAAAARYLGVDAADIALTDSTTMGLALTYQGLRLTSEDHVLTTTHDFYSTHEALRLAAVRAGAEVERISLYDDPSDADPSRIVSRLRAALRPTTRVVALTWVHSSTGVKLPVRQIADMLIDHDADRSPTPRPLLCLDAVHGFGVEDAGPVELGCDVFITGTHKWLFGPRGTGIVWASQRAATMIAPIIPPFAGEEFTGWLTVPPSGDRSAPAPLRAATTRSNTAGPSPRRSSSISTSGAAESRRAHT